MTDPIDAEDGRYPLCVSQLDRSVTLAAWEELIARTARYPAVYRMAGMIVRTVHLEGATITRQIFGDEFRTIIDRYLSCFRHQKKEDVACYPPKELAAMMLHEAEAPAPALRRITTVPVFDAEGRLRLTPGYDPQDGMLLLPDCAVAPVAHDPSAEDVTYAKHLLLGELLVDFPFAVPGDRAAAVAMILTPFVRELIHGPTPLHFVEAPSPGSGKGLLASVCLMPALGPRGTNWIAFPDEEDEARKQITSLLLEHRGAVLWDNLGRFLRSPTLAKLLTDVEWSDRRLGQSASVSIPVRALWVMTGNNPQMSDEIIRRVVPIRLVPDEERPEERQGFRHAELRAWAELARADLIWAAHTLVQSWLAHGRPSAPAITPLLGSFESYRAVVGGVLAHVGIEGFLDNRERLQAFSDPDTDRWRRFVELWFTRFGARETATSDLLPLAEEAEIPVRGDSERTRTGSLGSNLGHRRQRTYGGYRIDAGTGRNRRMWQLVDNSNGNGAKGNGNQELELFGVTPLAPMTPFLPVSRATLREIYGVGPGEKGATGPQGVTGPGLDINVPVGDEPDE